MTHELIATLALQVLRDVLLARARHIDKLLNTCGAVAQPVKHPARLSGGHPLNG